LHEIPNLLVSIVPFNSLQQQWKNLISDLIGRTKVLDSLLAPEGRQVVVEISTECSIGKPNKLEMEPLYTLAEHLKLTEKTQLLKFDIAQQSIGLGLR
jgi:hypothetical protein